MTKRTPRDWRGSEEDKNILKHVLQKSGVPLETRALNTVRSFCAAHASPTGLRAMDLGPALWRESDDAAYREIDAAALLEQRMAVGIGHVSIRILAYIFVEAKYREDVEWFAFISPHLAKFPATSNGAFSASVETVYTQAAASLPLSRMATLKTGNEGGLFDKAVPFKEERIAQNAAGAFADFLQHNKENPVLLPVPVLTDDIKQDLVRRFENRLDRGTSSGLRAFLSDLPVEEHQAFLNTHPSIPPITVITYIPLLVVNGRVNAVSIEGDGTITDITPREYAVTGERLPGWPPDEPFINPSDHFPLVVSSAEGMQGALEMIYAYVGKIRDAYFDAAVRSSLNAVAFESAVAGILKDKLRKSERLAKDTPNVVGEARSLFKSQITFPADKLYRNNLIVTVKNLGVAPATGVRVTATRLTGVPEVEEVGSLSPGDKAVVIFPLELDTSNQRLPSTLGERVVIEHDLNSPVEGRYTIHMVPSHPPQWDLGAPS